MDILLMMMPSSSIKVLFVFPILVLSCYSFKWSTSNAPSHSHSSSSSSSSVPVPREKRTSFSLYGTGADTGNYKTSDLFSLDSIRSTLIRQEETIIFALIERAQYRRNYDIYEPKKTKFKNVYEAPISFLEWMLIETEKLHSKVRRFTSPEEHPFFDYLLPPPVMERLNFPELLSVKKEAVNVNTEVLRWYVEKIIDDLCLTGDDEQHGSSVLCDIQALQAISRRVHFGKFVAESKYIENTEEYNSMVANDDVIGILDRLTNKEVERKVLRRAFLKASQYGQDITGDSPGFKVDPMLIANIYRDMIIPLTKDVEVRYLYLRCGKTPPSPDTYYKHCRGPMDAFEGKEAEHVASTDIVEPSTTSK